MSKIGEIIEVIANKIVESPNFEGISIYYDDSEIEPNTVKFPCIQFKAGTWRQTGICESERRLDCRILVNSEKKRIAILKLWDYAEDLQETINELIYDGECPCEISFIQGSEIAVFMHANADKDSYKGTREAFSSLIVLTYLLRY